jgi:hypothetical protein
MNRRALLVSAAKPTWSWNFSARPALPPGASFSRASTATYVDGAGVLRTASSNAPRFDCDPLTGTSLGYLAEMQSTNIIPWSEDFVGHWTSGSTYCTSAAAMAPNGSMTATKYRAAGVANPQLYISFASAAATRYAWSAFVRRDPASATPLDVTIVTQTGSSADQGTVWYNLAGAGTATKIGGIPLAAWGIHALANGWYFIWAQHTSTVAGTGYHQINLVNSATGSAIPSPDANSGVFIWGAQVEVGGVTSYIPTNGAAATRAADTLALPVSAMTGWNGGQGGAIVATYRLSTLLPTGSVQQAPAVLSDGSFDNVVFSTAYNNGSGGRRGLNIRSAGVDQVNIDTTAPPGPGVRSKLATGWGTSHAQQAADGVLISSVNTPVALPVGLTTLCIGGRESGSAQRLCGAIESVAYYAGARSDAFVQRVSR